MTFGDFCLKFGEFWGNHSIISIDTQSKCRKIWVLPFSDLSFGKKIWVLKNYLSFGISSDLSFGVGVQKKPLEMFPFFKAVWAKKRALQRPCWRDEAPSLREDIAPLPKGRKATLPQGAMPPLQLMITAAVCDQCSGAFPELLPTTGVCDQCLGAFIKL